MSSRLARFQADGFFVVDGLLDAEEVDLLRNIARADHEMQKQAASRGDGAPASCRARVLGHYGPV